MTKVKCVKGYYDTKLNRHVEVNELFSVDDERATQLVKARVAETVTTPKEVAEPAKTTKTRKKKEA